MSIENHIEEFIEALNGGRGTLDAWLECNNEAECRTAILGAISTEREACANVCDALGDCGPENGCCPTYWNEATERAAADIRKRSNAEITGG